MPIDSKDLGRVKLYIEDPVSGEKTEIKRIEELEIKYVADDLIKCECLKCGRQFIVSEYQAALINHKVMCTYCGSKAIDYVAGCNEEVLEELGCFGIYHYEQIREEVSL